MWAKIFFKFSSGVLFNNGLFYPQNFSWCQQRKFHLKLLLFKLRDMLTQRLF